MPDEFAKAFRPESSEKDQSLAMGHGTSLRTAYVTCAAKQISSGACTVRGLPPKTGMGLTAFLFDQRTDHLHLALPARKEFTARQSKCRIFGMIAGHLQQPMLREGVNDAADPAPIDRAGAHRTGFGSGVERRTP